jgi:hypothetical protein
MKCPYNQTEVYISWPMEPEYRSLDVENEDGTAERLHLTDSGRKYVINRVFADCLKSECAAWQNGRCVRTG